VVKVLSEEKAKLPVGLVVLALVQLELPEPTVLPYPLVLDKVQVLVE
jgi:hypothetical protein